MIFQIIPSDGTVPDTGKNTVYLRIDHWNDYSFVTMFSVSIFDEFGNLHTLPSVRIGFVGQTTAINTYSTFKGNFESLGEGYFSLGQSVDYYKQSREKLSTSFRILFLASLNDVVHNEKILEQAQNQRVFQVSHLRSITINKIKDQFVSVLSGEVVLTDFSFGFDLPADEKFAGFNLDFSVKANSLPSTNIHALIGRNGVGKTTILNSMVKAIAATEVTAATFYLPGILGGQTAMPENYLNGLISVAFSAFDPFDLPSEKEAAEQPVSYAYVGLTDYADKGGAIIKSRDALKAEFVESLNFCFDDPSRKSRWMEAVSTLASDKNFEEMGLLRLAELEGEERNKIALYLIDKMSSGHTIVILTLTQLVAKVEEKTLVLFDEPESHLHPPLLSALMRSLSQLLHSRNAIAIIATHSPVVLQEIPKSCVWKVYRERIASEWSRPETETFGENVGTLTREVFGLEVVKSGFHTILAEQASMGGTYEEVLARLGGSLGMEASGILMAMIIHRDTQQAQV